MTYENDPSDDAIAKDHAHDAQVIVDDLNRTPQEAARLVVDDSDFIPEGREDEFYELILERIED